MKHIKDFEIRKLSWINRGGLAVNYYEPETIEELIDLVKPLYLIGKSFDIVGHTSNIYFKDSYRTDILISSKRLNNYIVTDRQIICECGVNVHVLANDMVNRGIKGFEGLIDLPGTIGGAIYGNAGCYDCLVSDMMFGVEVLKDDGSIVVYNKKDLNFTVRASNFKRKILKGVILRVILNIENGDSCFLKKTAEKNHQLRLETQPSPKNNLGTTYHQFGEYTTFGYIISRFGGLYCVILKLLGINYMERNKRRDNFEISLAGGRDVIPYLFNRGRFIWKDDNADTKFIKYQKIIHRIYKNPQLEIEIYE